MRVYIGYDARDRIAYEVAEKSLYKHASCKVDVLPLYDWELRHKGLFFRSYLVDQKGQRFDDRDGKPFSTDFSFTRFCVPMLEDFGDEWVLFVDPDVLFRDDVSKLFDLAEDDKAVMCVQHQYVPEETEKMAGLVQTTYKRKNWSSLMLIKPSLCHQLTRYAVNNWTGQQLHAMTWVPDEQIGSLPADWNWLEGTSDPAINPRIVHYTRGTPDLPGYEDSAFAEEWRTYRSVRAA